MRTQQYELYAAEHEVPDLGRRFTDTAELQQWVDDLRDTEWWRRLYRIVLRVEAALENRQDSVGRWFPEFNGGRIEMSRANHPWEQYVIHELAHVLAAARFESKAHCPKFARVYLELTSQIRGSDAYLALDAAFKKHNIVS